MCFASQTPGLCSAFNFPSAPLPSLHTFYLSCFVCFASQTPGLCSAFNFPSAPLPSLHTFLFVMFLCASPHKHRVCVVLLISLRLSLLVLYSSGSRVGSGESARLPPMCPGFDSRTRRHMWAEFVGSLLCSERFFSGNSGFPLSSKTNI